jgi:putative ATP-dependent endonuclease of OLD family
MPTTELARSERLTAARIAVLKGEGGDGTTYTTTERESFVWYSYLFFGRGKPVTHMRVMADIGDDLLAAGLPPVLTRLLTRCAGLSGHQPAEQPG